MKQRNSQEAGDFSIEEREAVCRAIFARRDVREDFVPDPIPEKALRRILLAAHLTGSVVICSHGFFYLFSMRRPNRRVAPPS